MLHPGSGPQFDEHEQCDQVRRRGVWGVNVVAALEILRMSRTYQITCSTRNSLQVI